VLEDFERCYRAVRSRDTRFDGWFFTAVSSTGIYCRPSCPAMTPQRRHVRFYPTAAAAQQAGYRACLRCRPDAAPGSPEWLGRADVASRAVKLVLDGVVDREGVSGLARRLGYSERQLHRVLVAEVGTGAKSLARAQRAQTARLLLETTDLPVAHVAFGAGFASVRQFNDTVRLIFARTPTELRSSASRSVARGRGAQDRGTRTPPAISLRLALRRPFASGPLLKFLAARAISGVESFDGTTYSRSLRLAQSDGTVELTPAEEYVSAVFSLGDLRDLTTAVARVRHLLNLDADPVAVDEALGEDDLLAEMVRRTPGLRVAGSTDGFETAVRAVMGQQVSVRGARRSLAKVVEAAGRRLEEPRGSLTHVFCSPEELCELLARRPDALGVPAVRRRAIEVLSREVADGHLTLDPGSDPSEVEASLVAIAGIGHWTASYVRMRALGDPDAFLPTDLGLRRAAAHLGLPGDPASLLKTAQRWRPWRAYALGHLWSSLPDPDSSGSPSHTKTTRSTRTTRTTRPTRPTRPTRSTRTTRTNKEDAA